uniref:C6 domain-containing protein n=1 Tax=Panagrolaimus superbus TaxID=310955 RepID=A0A914YM88_9BILA
MDSGIGTDQDLQQVVTTGADGCVEITLTCTADVNTAQTVLTFYQAGVDVGTLVGTGSATAALTCNDAGELTYTTPLGSGVVDQVECTSI